MATVTLPSAALPTAFTTATPDIQTQIVSIGTQAWESAKTAYLERADASAAVERAAAVDDAKRQGHAEANREAGVRMAALEGKLAVAQAECKRLQTTTEYAETRARQEGEAKARDSAAADVKAARLEVQALEVKLARQQVEMAGAVAEAHRFSEEAAHAREDLDRATDDARCQGEKLGCERGRAEVQHTMSDVLTTAAARAAAAEARAAAADARAASAEAHAASSHATIDAAMARAEADARRAEADAQRAEAAALAANERAAATERRLAELQHTASNSSRLGLSGEATTEELLNELIDSERLREGAFDVTRSTARSGDFLVRFLSTELGRTLRVVVDSKAHADVVPGKDEVPKLLRDVDERDADGGVLFALHARRVSSYAANQIVRTPKGKPVVIVVVGPGQSRETAAWMLLLALNRVDGALAVALASGDIDFAATRALVKQLLASADKDVQDRTVALEAAKVHRNTLYKLEEEVGLRSTQQREKRARTQHATPTDASAGTAVADATGVAAIPPTPAASATASATPAPASNESATVTGALHAAAAPNRRSKRQRAVNHHNKNVDEEDVHYDDTDDEDVADEDVDDDDDDEYTDSIVSSSIPKHRRSGSGRQQHIIVTFEGAEPTTYYTKSGAAKALKTTIYRLNQLLIQSAQTPGTPNFFKPCGRSVSVAWG